MKNTYKFIFIFTFVFIASAVYWYLYNKPVWGIDDANIYMVYMRNFALGHGFVYNVGGEKVEGFTSLLWCIIGSVFYKLSPSHFSLMLIGLNIVTISYALYKTLLFCNRTLNNDSTISVFDVFLLSSLFLIPGFFEWQIFALLETGFWTSVLTLIILNTLEYVNGLPKPNNIAFTILLCLLVLTRPEGTMWGAIFIGIRFVTFLWFKHKKIIPELFVPSIVFAVTNGLLFIWRLKYFGFIFPNTYYAKVSSNILDNVKEGLVYLRAFLFDTNPLALFAIITFLFYVVIIARNLAKRQVPSKVDITIGIAGIIILIATALPVTTGGDPFKLNRFYQCAMPIYLLLLIITVSELIGSHAPTNKLIRYYILFAMLFIVSFLPQNNLWHSFHVSHFSLYEKTLAMPLQFQFDLIPKGKGQSDSLNRFFDKNSFYPTQGVLAAGAPAYYYKGKTNDLLGLNNVEMAHADKIKSTTNIKSHESFNKNVFYKQQPDIFLFSIGFITDTVGFENRFYHLSEFGPNSFLRRAYKNIIEDKRFNSLYKPVIISKKDDNIFLYTYVNNAFASKLDTSYYSIKEIGKQ